MDFVCDFIAWDGAPSLTGRVESRGSPLLKIALKLLPRGIQFNLRSKGDLT
jgi:hypothetical protein